MPNLNLVDRKIIDELQRAADQTYEEIGIKVGASRSVVQRRIASLKMRGVIKRYTIEVEPGKIGRFMSFIVSISLEREDRDIVNRFKQSIKNCSAVQQCFYVTGDADFIIILTAKDMAEYDDIVQSLCVDNPNIRAFLTNVVIRPVKTGLDVPAVESI